MTGDDDILYSTDARGVATLTFNRPGLGNAYGASFLQGMLVQLDRWRSDEKVRVIIIQGQGKHFCVGADLKAPGASGLVEVCMALDTIDKPTIARVQGACIGGGVAFAACCDIVVAERTAFFSIPEVRIGLAPGPLAPFFLRAMGARQLRRYGLSGERFSAEEAQRVGLVHEVIDAPGSIEFIVDACLMGAPGALAELKRTIAAIEHAEIDHALRRSLQERFDARRHSPEATEGVAAFKEKRKPRWFADAATARFTAKDAS